MDLKLLENIIAIENEQSISKAAEKLFMTQSALNQQLLKLEKELGTPLFERKRHQMIATFAGRLYLTTAKQMLEMKNDTYKIIHDISASDMGEISLSYTPERGSVMFSSVYPVFHSRFPKVSFNIKEARGKKMEQLLLHHDTTYAFMTYSDEFPLNSQFECFEIGRELMILGVPSSHRLAHLAGEDSHIHFPEVDLKLFKNDSFVLTSNETLLRRMIDLAFATAGFAPRVLFESSSSQTVVNMVKQQICPAFFPQSYVEKSNEMVYFSVKPVQSWMRCVAYLRGTYITHAERELMQLVKSFTNNEPPFSGNAG